MAQSKAKGIIDWVIARLPVLGLGSKKTYTVHCPGVKVDYGSDSFVNRSWHEAFAIWRDLKEHGCNDAQLIEDGTGKIILD
jgi:hypothetical protein